jgi:colanic acid/amylovoran biosynthesis protein
MGTDLLPDAWKHDMAFALEPIPPPIAILEQFKQVRARGPVLGLNVSGLLLMGGYTRDNMFGLKSPFAETIRQLIRQSIERDHAQILLIPHVMGGPEDAESDVGGSRKLMQELSAEFPGSLHFIDYAWDQHEVKFLIGQCDLLVGARMHACIAALSQGVPAVGLSYSRKFRGVFQTIGVEDLALDLRSMSSEEICSSISDIWARRSALAAQLTQTMPAVKERVLGLFTEIVRDLPARAA